MSYAASAQTFALFPSSPTVPNAFNIYTFSQSPRENHAMVEDLLSIFRPRENLAPRDVLRTSYNEAGRRLRKSTSSPSLKTSFKRLFGIENARRDDTPPQSMTSAQSDSDSDSVLTAVSFDSDGKSDSTETPPGTHDGCSPSS
ncbi:hypothetical protein PHLCEN_2v1605 [Hermanssonia centrifuga]|uniref:Uncharacterized protein n=1 Tax=Hermanssonia centrifuga TaxID=98765 RepID=A0A2R6RZJ5_9APHY|nr:hypothetical protein PHLCEN_2v1605 [Hermanssonia centrifuga]